MPNQMERYLKTLGPNFKTFKIKNLGLFLLSLAIYITHAFYNVGYYHYDEHYQLIEFAELKSGNNQTSDLAWEYSAQVRSALQPGIAYVSLNFFRFFEINDPYILMFLIRACSGILMLIAITYFVKNTEHLLRDGWKLPYLCISYFLWFLPFVNIRFSSETYSALTFLVAVGLWHSKVKKQKHILIGILLGLSFLFRFQTAFMSLGFIAWLAFTYRIHLRPLITIIVSGSLVVVLLGGAVDYWFYQKITISFYNYFVSNVINDIASTYGVSPWYHYFELSYDSMHIWAIMLWFIVIKHLITKRSDLLTWVLLPFLVVHIVIPHKEMRFLIPIANFLPLIAVLSMQSISDAVDFKKLHYRIATTITLIFLFFINLLATIVNTFGPADTRGSTKIIQEIYSRYDGGNVVLWGGKFNNPYRPIPANQNYYGNDKVLITPFYPTMKELKNDDANLIVLKRSNVKSIKKLSQLFKVKKIQQGVPEWIFSIKSFLGYDVNPLILYELKR